MEASDQSQAKLTLSLGGIQHAFSVRIEDLSALQDQKDAFLRSRSQASLSETREPRSPAELVLDYLEFLSCRNLPPSLIKPVLLAFSRNFLHDTEIHSLLAKPEYAPQTRQRLVRTYYIAALSAAESHVKESALLDAARHGNIQLATVFGGQSTANPACVRELAELFATYTPFLGDLISTTAPILSALCRLPETKEHFCGRYIDIETWLHDPASVPDGDFIATAPVSCPVIGLLNLAHYAVTCHVLGKTPSELKSHLQGVTGHSQGIVAAVAISLSDSWESFYEAARMTVETLFWIGFECHQRSPRTSVSLDQVQDSLQNGHGRPSCMLSIVGLSRAHIQDIILKLNRSLPENEQVYLALNNARDSFVVSGPSCSLVHLHTYLRSLKADASIDQTRIPHSLRKPTVQHQFLPVSVPFHTPYLQAAARVIKERLFSRRVVSDKLTIPVYDNRTGNDLRKLDNVNLIHAMVDSICWEPCNWPAALDIADISHIVAFGSGGVGELAMRLKDGQGVRVIMGSEFQSRDEEIGTKADLFSPTLLASSTNVGSWGERFRPRLSKSPMGEVKIETKLSRLLDTPPLMVAGMTPTTAAWDFVSVITNAGYHVELAGGGYYNMDTMAVAVKKLVASIPPGRGITCNVIYASPQTLSWQITLLRRLSSQGLPIDGLTIGAGIPSLEVVSEYIQALGLRHISLKPGSITAIREVIKIAKAHPHFPIILQWTGGRGGGHHSFEDFHAPILRTYGAIRRCSNIILVAGSGFGGSEDTYPYLSGTWSARYGLPAMPFDGILLGSRIMVAKEAHTSPAAKRLITEAPGVSDSDWEKTYQEATGGIITVVSEMGQPIHKIATRGVLFWAEMDKTIFSLPRTKRVPELLKRRDYIIKRLNADFAKPWFGQNSKGEPVDLAEMTYIEVLRRLVALMYVSHQSRWIDPSYMTLLMAVSVRFLERFSIVDELDDALVLREPHRFVEDIVRLCPAAAHDILSPEDVAWFLLRCKTRGQKPVNFIPALDDDFETFFKKDSLWQSEDVDALIDQDAGRCCILHGPVAAQYSQDCNEPAKEILDGITQSWIDMIRQDFYPGGVTPSSDNGSLSSESWSVLTPDLTSRDESAPLDIIPEIQAYHPSISSLGRSGSPWIHALLADEFTLQGRDRRPNPCRRVFHFGPGGSLQFDREKSEIIVSMENHAGNRSVMRIVCENGVDISVDLQQPSAYTDEMVSLPLKFQYDLGMIPFGISEVIEGRNERIKSFYSKVWFGEDICSVMNARSVFHGSEMALTEAMHRDLLSTVSLAYPHSETALSGVDVFPISVGMFPVWDAMARPLVVNDIDGDLLRLVHESNTFEYCEDSTPLRVGDVVSSTAAVRAVYIEDAGKHVVVEASIERSGRPVMKVVSTFLFKGIFNDWNSTFKTNKEPEMVLNIQSDLDELVLRDRGWLLLHDPSQSLVGCSLLFRLETRVTWKNRNTYGSLDVSGLVFLKQASGDLTEIGTVAFHAGECVGNPVLSFLQRKGSPATSPTPLTSPGWLGISSLEVQLPTSNEMYTRISRDYNPIHVSPLFAQWADLPGTITQGMYTSAISAAVLEHLALNGDRRRFRRFSARFTDMVLPGDRLLVVVKHVGSIQGRMLFNVSAFKQATNSMVLEAEAELEQPPTAFIFTGQGSQKPNMGMDLYNNSPVAKAVWDEADKYIFETYGWSILDIVKNNPRTLTIHFRGKHGRKIRANYLSMENKTTTPDGQIVKKPILPGLTDQTQSYTFTEPSGLLFFSTFAQPSIVVMEKATFEDMRSRGLIPQAAVFAGHSLGEYGALLAFSGFMSVRDLVDLVFYRGLSMQFAMERDERGETNFGMVAASPQRVGKSNAVFTESHLRSLVQMISIASHELLEMVNLNIENEQYVCAGTDAETQPLLQEMSTTEDLTTTKLYELILKSIPETKKPPMPIRLQRGRCTIPIPGIDVPFHSSYLRSTVSSYRKILQRCISEENIHLERLVGRWIPNVTAKPFMVDEGYVREVFNITQSPILKEILEL
uniref:Fatty acid synthase beta subunit n=1 Tax=Monascus pilosus TaxID=89488 RepID=R9UP03_MONPI|nr:fatty acid synthase beta subunit [Monascus pilosus]